MQPWCRTGSRCRGQDGNEVNVTEAQNGSWGQGWGMKCAEKDGTAQHMELLEAHCQQLSQQILSQGMIWSHLYSCRPCGEWTWGGRMKAESPGESGSLDLGWSSASVETGSGSGHRGTGDRTDCWAECGVWGKERTSGVLILNHCAEDGGTLPRGTLSREKLQGGRAKYQQFFPSHVKAELSGYWHVRRHRGSGMQCRARGIGLGGDTLGESSASTQSFKPWGWIHLTLTDQGRLWDGRVAGEHAAMFLFWDL